MVGDSGVERRGCLVSDSTGESELLVLRRGVLRIFAGGDAPRRRGAPDGTVQLAFRCQVSAQGSLLELRAKVPIEYTYVFRAKGAAEAEAWRQALVQSIEQEAQKMRHYTEFLDKGCTAYKYNYSNSKRMRRHFWVDEARCELCWGKSRSDEPQKLSMKDSVGLIYGPMTTTFQRCSTLEDSPWCCFSLIFPDRTVDLAVPNDYIDQWFLGLQHVLLEKETGCVSALSEPQFVFRKVQFRIRASAHRQGITTRTLLSRSLRALGKDLGLRDGGRRGSSKADAEAESKEERKKKKKEAKAAKENGHAPVDGAVVEKKKKRDSKSDAKEISAGTNGHDRASSPQDDDELLVQTCADLERELEAQTTKLESFRSAWENSTSGKMIPMDSLAEVLRSSDNLSWQAEKCSELEREVLTLKGAGQTMQVQSAVAEKAEKKGKKVSKQLQDAEAQVAALEQELQAAKSGASNSESAKFSSTAARERAEAQSQQLERRVQELEQQLQQVEKGKEMAAMYKEKNKQQQEELQRHEAQKLQLQQELDSMAKDYQKTEKKHQENERRLAECSGQSRNLVNNLKALKKAVSVLQSEHKQVKGECDSQLRSISDSFPPLSGAVTKIGASVQSMHERYREIAEERRKLHNLVLELKGNIRVFVRVRPMSEKEKLHEPDGDPTITFAEDCKISVFDSTPGKRKWFDFDKCFAPKTQQHEVFEEVKPLATSVLDGYNVCIFAYGQTGSGKTFTMSGNAENPGLNVRTLRELFRIREERRDICDIDISLMVTEIYNETIKDLFVEKQKKLEVKTEKDGSNTVPGLTEVQVTSTEDVLARMQEASGNRTVMATDMNDESSRSHSIVQVKTIVRNKTDNREYIGKINLIDLAGSENVNKSGVEGQGLREAQNINKSLSALGDVISALIAKTPHVPYRNSKLTQMLKDSLGGDSKTLMIVQTSPAQCNVTETLSSLNFASRARNVELGKAKRNVKGGE